MLYYNKEFKIIKTKQQFAEEGVFVPDNFDFLPEGWYGMVMGEIPEYDNEFYSLRHTEPVQVGNHFVWGFETFINVDLEEAKVIQSKRINQAREQARLNEGAEYNNDLFDIDDKAQSNILAKVTMASLSSDDSIFTYRSKTNITHTFTKAEIIALGLAIGDKIDKVYEKSWLLKKKVDEANTVEEVEAIKWNM